MCQIRALVELPGLRWAKGTVDSSVTASAFPLVYFNTKYRNTPPIGLEFLPPTFVIHCKVRRVPCWRGGVTTSETFFYHVTTRAEKI